MRKSPSVLNRSLKKGGTPDLGKSWEEVGKDQAVVAVAATTTLNNSIK